VARLRRNYRCRDERLMAFAAEHIYGGELETLPGPDGGDAPGGDDVLSLEQVDGTGPVVAGVDAVESTDAEVFRVVDLVLDHARRRPGESLGVVTLTARHAARIDEALHRAAAEDPGLARFFADNRAEPFAVKDVERAQGDTRDAVVLSIGYGRTPHGRVLHAFGPLSAPGGERRLAVATTRARRRLTVVSSFGADDLDPARLETAGARLLRELLAYAAAGGSPGAGVSPPPSYRDPLLDDLAARLEADGLTVRRRYGISGSLDLAVGDESGRLLVAVESDGPAYAAMSSTRERDRLRVEHLQRLGWSHLRLWSTDIFRDPAREVARVKAAVRAAAGPVRAVPLEQTRDDTDVGWGESAAPHDRERWLLDERPPHWG
jgi:very-short-patch-repair endonuclease